MFRSYRGFILAFGIACFLTASAQEVLVYSGGEVEVWEDGQLSKPDRFPEDRISKDETDTRYNKGSPVPIVITSGSPPHEDNPADDAKKNREIADLKAQETMAFWAMPMGFASILAAIAAGVAAFLVWLSVGHTRKALKEAETAAKHSETMLVESRQATYREQRAYLSIEGISGLLERTDTSYSAGKLHFVIEIFVKNNGSTPATGVQSGFNISQRTNRTVKLVTGSEERPTSDIAPGQIHRERFEFTESWDAGWLVKADRYQAVYSAVGVTGFFYYTDFSGAKHTLEFDCVSETIPMENNSGEIDFNHPTQNEKSEKS